MAIIITKSGIEVKVKENLEDVKFKIRSSHLFCEFNMLITQTVKVDGERMIIVSDETIKIQLDTTQILYYY